MILGFYITCEFVINTPEKLRQKLDMVNLLSYSSFHFWLDMSAFVTPICFDERLKPKTKLE